MNSRRRNLVFLITFLVLIFAVYQWMKPLSRSNNITQSNSASTTHVQASQKPSPSKDSVSPTAITTQAGEPPADPVFAKWIEREGDEVNRPKVDSTSKAIEMQRVVADLNAKQQRQLLQTLLDTAANAGSRILSIYLLSEAGSRADGEIAAFLQAPVPNFGPSEPHSEAELRNQQERAMRLMAIDAMAARALKDPSAVTTFEKTVPTISDPFVRGYAQKKLKEVQSSTSR